MRALVRSVVDSLRGRDVALHAAAVTFYGGIAVVPVGLLAIRLAALFAGPDTVAESARFVVAATPSAIGADRAAAALVAAGLHLSLGGVAAALLPATLYGEGLRRSLVSLVRGRTERAVGWRGRLLIAPVLAAGPGLLLALLLLLPSAARMLGRGGAARVVAVVLSFLIVWIVLSPVVVWVYRMVGPDRPAWLGTVVGGSFAAANLSGFMHGFVLFCSLPLDLGYPFGGFDAIGAVVAVALWLYLFHLVLLVGYVFTLRLAEMISGRRSSAADTSSGP